MSKTTFRASVNVKEGEVFICVFEIPTDDEDPDRGYLIEKPRCQHGPEQIVRLGDFSSRHQALESARSHPLYVEHMEKVKAMYPTLWMKDCL